MSGVQKPSAAFAQIARRLNAIQLMNEDGESDLAFTAQDFSEKTGDAPFLDFYSPVGMRKAFEAYGIDDKLRQKGIGDYEMVAQKTDAGHHRLEIFIDGERDDAHRIMDLRVHLVSGNVGGLDAVPLFVVEWLSMQNPRAEFTAHRPRLPGQRFPSTGFGRDTNNLLIIAAQRLRRHALVHVPERFHLAELYHRGGSRYANEEYAQKFDAIYDATKSLSFSHRAWAVERGFVKEGPDGATAGAAVKMPPHEMVLALSKEVADHVSERGFLQKWIDKVAAPKLVFDRAGYAESLKRDPIEGMPTRL